MARTKQTARKTTGGMRPRMHFEPPTPGSVVTIRDLLARAAELEPLAVGSRSVPEPQKPSALPSRSGEVVGIGIGTFSEWAFPNVGAWVAEYLDPRSLMRCRMTSKAVWKAWGMAMEACMCDFFLITTDTKRVAEERVEGGWMAFVNFLAQVAAMVQRSFDALMLRPPALYRALLAQQAIRRIDGSPHPPLQQLVAEGSSGCAAWKCDVLREHEVPQGPRVVPSLLLCFGYCEGLQSDTFLILPKYDAIPGERICDSKSVALLEAHVAWIAEHGEDSSIRQAAASNGERPFVFLAREGSDSYASHIVLTLDDEDTPVLKYFSDFQLEDRVAENPFLDVENLNDINSLFFTLPWEGDTWEWDTKNADKFTLVAWAALAKALGISPFKEFDVENMMAAIEAEGDGKRPRRHIITAPQSYEELWREVEDKETTYLEWRGKDIDEPSLEEAREGILTYFAALARVPHETSKRELW